MLNVQGRLRPSTQEWRRRFRYGYRFAVPVV
jgi:hypothetical protein